MAEIFKEEYLGKDLKGNDIYYHQTYDYEEDSIVISITKYKEILTNLDILITLIEKALDENNLEDLSVNISKLPEGVTDYQTIFDYDENLNLIIVKSEQIKYVGFLQKFNNEDRVDFGFWNSKDKFLYKTSFNISSLQVIDYEENTDE